MIFPIDSLRIKALRSPKPKEWLLAACLFPFCLTLSCQKHSSELPQPMPEQTKPTKESSVETFFVTKELEDIEVRSKFNRLQEEIEAERREQVGSKLEELGIPEAELLEFQQPRAAFLENSTIYLDVPLEYKGKLEHAYFSKKEMSDRFEFEFVEGFKEVDLIVQAICFLVEDSCNILALEVSYLYGKVRLFKRFEIENPNPKILASKERPEVFISEIGLAANMNEEDQLPEFSTGSDPEVNTSKPNPILDDFEKIMIAPDVKPAGEQHDEEAQENPVSKPVSPQIADTDTEVPTSPPKDDPAKDETIVSENPAVDSGSTGSFSFSLPKIDIGQGISALNLNTGDLQEPAGEEESEGKEPINETPHAKDLLDRIQNEVFNQAEFFYGYDEKSKSFGRLKNAEAFDSEHESVLLAAKRKGKHYASTLSILVLDYAIQKTEQRFSGAKICIHDASKKEGGEINDEQSRQSSHQNGLDVESSFISQQVNQKDCDNEKTFKSWEDYQKEDSDFLASNWQFVKSLVESERTHVIFTDRGLIRALCRFSKEELNESEDSRNKVFKRLHHISGHKDHYHIRFSCTSQNKCIPQKELRGSICN